MKKLLTFLIALITISALSFGQNGNVWTWNGSAGDNDWQNTLNWTKGGIPYAGVVGTANVYPGQAGATEDEVYIDANNTSDPFSPFFIKNVPQCTLGALDITFTPGASLTQVSLNGASDGVIMTFQKPTAARIANYGPYWYTLKIDEDCILDMDQKQFTFSPYNRIKVYAEPNAHVWQKNNAAFYPSRYENCDNERGFWLMAEPGRHAEFIQQQTTAQSIKGWADYVLDDNKYHYICPPITSQSIKNPGNLEDYATTFCRKHNCLCVFDGDYVRKFVNGTGWDSWLGVMGTCFNPLVDIEVGRGYEYYGNSANNPSGIYSFYGYFNSGDPIAMPITTLGWNLIGNPFASAIQFGPPSGQPTAGPGWDWNAATVSPAAYWWNNNMGIYQYYNWFSGLGNGPVLLERRTLPRSQGFFVNVVNPQAFLAIGNQARFFRGEAEIAKNDVANYLMLTFKDQSGNFIDNAVINFRSDASGTAFNEMLDTYKMELMAETSVEKSLVYFTTTDNVNVASKTLKLEAGNIMYPLSVKTLEGGTYTLDASEMTFSPNAAVTLHDNITNANVDLKANPVYTFTSAAGYDDARFNLYFANVASGISNPDNNVFKVYSYNNAIFVQNNDLNATGQIIVYDMIGKQIIEENMSSGITKINTNLNKGFYIVSVKTDNGIYTQKVYIN